MVFLQTCVCKACREEGTGQKMGEGGGGLWRNVERRDKERRTEDAIEIRIHTVVNVQAEVDHTRKHHILHRRANLRVREEKRHRDERARHHRILPPQRSMAHVPRQHGAPDAAEVDKRVVAPGDVRTGLAKRRTSAGQIGGQEDVIQGVRESDQRP